MGQHNDYIFKHRTRVPDRAVGFGGQIRHFTNEKTNPQKKNKKSFYYPGSDNRREQNNLWLNLIIILPIAILIGLGFSPLFGLVALLVSLLILIAYFVFLPKT